MRKNIFQTNYDRLVKLGIFGGELANQPYRRSQSNGFMDLVVERVPHYDSATGNTGVAFSLAHYFVQNGDLCQDPEMVVVVYPEVEMVEALTFQQAIPPIYQEVYPEPRRYYPSVKRELNSFLRQWLNNLIAQKHGQNWSTESE